jgi:hypothetical protein
MAFSKRKDGRWHPTQDVPHVIGSTQCVPNIETFAQTKARKQAGGTSKEERQKRKAGVSSGASAAVIRTLLEQPGAPTPGTPTDDIILHLKNKHGVTASSKQVRRAQKRKSGGASEDDPDDGIHYEVLQSYRDQVCIPCGSRSLGRPHPDLT